MLRAQRALWILIVCVGTAPAFAQASFRRADSNADARLDVSDATHLLGFLFLGGSAPPCRDAADANDDGLLDVSDAVASLAFLFLGAAAPPEPFASCGPDPSADELDCRNHAPCPQGPVFPPPDPDPCGGLGQPCESAVIGPYTLVSAPDGDGIFTRAAHRDGEVLHLRWVPAGEAAMDLFVGKPEGPALDPQRIDAGLPTLRNANVLAAVALILNGPGPLEGAGGGADGFSGNHAGCDPNGWMSWADCISCGGCCDAHDACIDANCRTGTNSGDVRVCLALDLEYAACQINPLMDDEECEALPRCDVECMACHRTVMACFDRCLAPLGTGPGPSDCCGHDDCGKPQQCIINGVVETNADRCLIPEATSWGDPHLVSFDRLAYDFQAVGEFVMTRSADGELVVQARTAPWGRSRHVAVTTALAMKVAGDRLGFYGGRSPLLRVNGADVSLGAEPLALPGGGRIELRGATYVVAWPDGDQALVASRGLYFDLRLRLQARRAGRVEGLLGDADGRREADLKSRGGQPLAARPTLRQLYEEYGESWRISSEESLFEYFDGDTTESHTDRTFPDGLAGPDRLSPEARRRAEETCAAAGVTDPVLLEACIVDVGFTGETAFAESAAAVDPPGERLEPPVCDTPAVTWTDWTSGTAVEARGDLGTLEVTLTGVIANPQVQGGANYWATTPATFTKPGIVNDPPGTSDIIALIGGAATGVQTLAFSSPVIDPVMAIFSLGRPGVSAIYDFDTPFEILNVGPGHFGNGTLVQLEGDVLSGQEGYGLIRFPGVISSISWTMPNAENWHGIQVGRVDCR